MGYDLLMSNGDERIEDAAEGVRDRLEIGYRQIDTAAAYDNEHDLGRGIAERASNFSVGLSRQAIENAPVFEVFNFDLGQPESDEIDPVPTDGRSANLPWEPDWNA